MQELPAPDWILRGEADWLDHISPGSLFQTAAWPFSLKRVVQSYTRDSVGVLPVQRL
jgi:hypothetical protein